MKKILKAIAIFFLFSIVFRLAFALGVPVMLGLFLVLGAGLTSMPMVRLWLSEWWNK